VATEHPKITAYIPKEILIALDNWKHSNEIKSRSEAIVRILENYLEVPHIGVCVASVPKTTLSPKSLPGKG
jgi:hypothetical protein